VERLAAGAASSRFTRHAKNRARDINATVADAEELTAYPERVDFDPHGNWRYVGRIRGERVRVVVALDDPDLIVTIHRR
jgi:mRNA-degrading endonuclease RelE of RelBE toxin-antitoxin system